MNITLESNPGVVSITIETLSREGNPLALRFARWPGRHPHLDDLTEHMEGNDSLCQYRPEGRCCPRSPGCATSALIGAVSQAQALLNLNLYQIASALLHKHSDSFQHEGLFAGFEEFAAMEIPEGRQ